MGTKDAEISYVDPEREIWVVEPRGILASVIDDVEATSPEEAIAAFERSAVQALRELGRVVGYEVD